MTSRTVAILGASADRSKFGNKSVRAHQAAGYTVFPVNLKAGQIEGLPAYPSLAQLPVERLDRISLYLPPAVAQSALESIKAIECPEVYFNPGCDSPELLRRARELGINAIADCSIVALGMSPRQFPDA